MIPSESIRQKIYSDTTHIRIIKKRAQEMSCSSNVLRTFEFFWVQAKVLRAAEKNKEKVEANCTGFSAEFFGSQSVEMFCFARKTKIQILTTSSRSLTRIYQRLLKSLGLYCLFTTWVHEKQKLIWNFWTSFYKSCFGHWLLVFFHQNNLIGQKNWEISGFLFRELMS